MRITTIITENLIKTGLTSTSRDSMFEELLDFFCNEFPQFHRDTLLDLLHKREAKGSTNVGEGLAIPHGKAPEMDTTYGAIGISPEGIDFEDDKDPVHLIFMLFSEEDPGGIHLRVLGAIACLMKDPDIRARLCSAATPEEAFAIIVEGEKALALDTD